MTCANWSLYARIVVQRESKLRIYVRVDSFGQHDPLPTMLATNGTPRGARPIFKTSIKVGPAGTHHYVASRTWLLDRAISSPVVMDVHGRRIACWRGAGTDLVLMDDACVHRAAPLSSGCVSQVEGKPVVRCIYHNWAFDSHGVLVDVPSEPCRKRLPKRAVQKSYDTVDIDGDVYIFSQHTNVED